MCSHMLPVACMQPFKFKYGNKVLKGPKGTQLYRVAGGTDIEQCVGTTFAYEVRRSQSDSLMCRPWRD